MYSFTFTITFIYIYKLFTFFEGYFTFIFYVNNPPPPSPAMTDYSNSKSLFLGFDLSTQQLKIIITDENLTPLDTYNVEFDSQFKSKYTKINKGVITGDDGEVISPVAMWLDAINYVFDEMQKSKFPFDKVVGISGSGQQHGSVYWSGEANELLNDLIPCKELSSQLQDAFSWGYSPNYPQ